MRAPTSSEASALFMALAVVLAGLAVGHYYLWQEAVIDVTASNAPDVHYVRGSRAEALFFNLGVHGDLLVRARYDPLRQFAQPLDFFVTEAGGLEYLLEGERPLDVYYEVPAGEMEPHFFTVQRHDDYDAAPNVLDAAQGLVPANGTLAKHPNGHYTIRPGELYPAVPGTSLDFVWVRNLSATSSQESGLPLNDTWGIESAETATVQYLFEIYPGRLRELQWFPPLEIGVGLAMGVAGFAWVAATARRQSSPAPSQRPEATDLLVRLTEQGESYLRSLRRLVLLAALILLLAGGLGLHGLLAAIEGAAWYERYPSTTFPMQLLLPFVVAIGGAFIAGLAQWWTVQRELRRWRLRRNEPALPE